MKVTQARFTEKFAGHLRRIAPLESRESQQRRAYAKAGIDPRKATRRWS